MPPQRHRAYFKACIKCKLLVPPSVEECPNCSEKEFSEEWEGIIIVINAESSLIAKRLNITRPGRYAVKLRA